MAIINCYREGKAYVINGDSIDRIELVTKWPSGEEVIGINSKLDSKHIRVLDALRELEEALIALDS